jgi:hypothetical protein
MSGGFDHELLQSLLMGVSQSNNLRDAAGELLTYDWLPVEGRDFYIQYDEATANGVTIESPVFCSTAPS